MRSNSRINRCQVLRLAGTGAVLAAGGSLVRPDAASAASLGANDRIRLGVIGCGGMGTRHLEALAVNPHCEVAAVCDCFTPRYENAVAKVHEIIARHRLREIENRQSSLAPGAHDTDLQGLLGIIGRWWVVGPFDLGDKNQGWATSYIGEPNVNVVARYMSGKTRRQWKRVESQDSQGKIDLRATIADRDNCIGYAYAEIELQKPVDAVLLLGVDDSEKIWVNGKQIFEQFTARPLQVDQDRVPVHLEAGTNKILLKLYQNNQGWEFCVRIVSADGRPVPFKQRSE